MAVLKQWFVPKNRGADFLVVKSCQTEMQGKILSLAAPGTAAPQSGAVHCRSLTSHQDLQCWRVSQAAPRQLLALPVGDGEEQELTGWSLSLAVPKLDSSNRAEGSRPERAKRYPARTQAVRWLAWMQIPTQAKWILHPTHTAHRERQQARIGKAPRQSLTAPHTVWGAAQDQHKANAHHHILKSPQSETPYCP